MTTQTSPHTGADYRSDVDGLRAIAVLAVVGFHAFPRYVPGGFVGVDIFFVISGYLISSNILADYRRGRFSILGFYQRRVRRIFPALAVVLACTLAGGFVVFGNDFELRFAEYRALQIHVAAGAGFVSNLVLWSESGYFDAAAQTKPLLHLWSLGIEEQFYIVWPLALGLLWSRQARLRPWIGALAAASFAAGLVALHRWPIAAFYSPVFRFWELLIGAFLACGYPKPGEQPLGASQHRSDSWLNVRSAAAGCGLLMLAIALAAVNEHTRFPGWWALLPTCGTALILGAGNSTALSRSILSRRSLVWVGLISYPLYLWHWPLLAFANVIYKSGPPRALRLAVVIASIALAWLTYRFVEMPVRYGSHRRRLTLVSVASIAVIFLVAITPSRIIRYQTLTPAQQAAISQLQAAAAVPNIAQTYGACFKFTESQTVQLFIENGCLSVSDPQLPTLLLIGDSHSGALGMGLRPFAVSRRWNYLQVSTAFCEPTSNNSADETCQDINRVTLEHIGQIKPELVVLNEHWLGAQADRYFAGGDFVSHVRNLSQRLLDAGAHSVLLVGQMPVWNPSLPVRLSLDYVKQQLPIPARTYAGISEQSLALDARMRAVRYPSGVEYLPMRDLLCDQTGCLTMVGPDLKEDILLWDYGHLTPAGATFVVRKMQDVLSAAMRPGRHN